MKIVKKQRDFKQGARGSAEWKECTRIAKKALNARSWEEMDRIGNPPLEFLALEKIYNILTAVKGTK